MRGEYDFSRHAFLDGVELSTPEAGQQQFEYEFRGKPVPEPNPVFDLAKEYIEKNLTGYKKASNFYDFLKWTGILASTNKGREVGENGNIIIYNTFSSAVAARMGIKEKGKINKDNTLHAREPLYTRVLTRDYTHLGKDHRSKEHPANIGMLYQITVDLDKVLTEKNKIGLDILRGIETGKVLAPTEIKQSGNGLHLVYVFKTPFDAGGTQQKIEHLNALKRGLYEYLFRQCVGAGIDVTRKIFDCASIHQGYSVVGAPTKDRRNSVLGYVNPSVKYSIDEIAALGFMLNKQGQYDFGMSSRALAYFRERTAGIKAGKKAVYVMTREKYDALPNLRKKMVAYKEFWPAPTYKISPRKKEDAIAHGKLILSTRPEEGYRYKVAGRIATMFVQAELTYKEFMEYFGNEYLEWANDEDEDMAPFVLADLKAAYRSALAMGVDLFRMRNHIIHNSLCYYLGGQITREDLRGVVIRRSKTRVIDNKIDSIDIHSTLALPDLKRYLHHSKNSSAKSSEIKKRTGYTLSEYETCRMVTGRLNKTKALTKGYTPHELKNMILYTCANSTNKDVLSKLSTKDSFTICKLIEFIKMHLDEYKAKNEKTGGVKVKKAPLFRRRTKEEKARDDAEKQERILRNYVNGPSFRLAKPLHAYPEFLYNKEYYDKVTSGDLEFLEKRAYYNAFMEKYGLDTCTSIKLFRKMLRNLMKLFPDRYKEFKDFTACINKLKAYNRATYATNIPRKIIEGYYRMGITKVGYTNAYEYLKNNGPDLEYNYVFGIHKTYKASDTA